MLEILKKLYNTQVKEILPDKLWNNEDLLVNEHINLVLDMFGKTENDDFKLSDLFDAIIDEFPKYRSGLLLSKTDPSLYWLAFSPYYVKNDFFDINTKDFIKFINENTEKENRPIYSELEDILLFRDEIYQFTNQTLDIDTSTIGSVMKGMEKAINVWQDMILEFSLDPLFSASGDEYRKLADKAYSVLNSILFAPYRHLFYNK